MSFHLPLFKDEAELPTGKNHVSFSEVSTAFQCRWRHKLKYVDGLKDGGSEHTVYGSHVHEALEYWLLNKDSCWFDNEENAIGCQNAIKEGFEEIGFNPKNKLEKDWLEPASEMINGVPEWMETTFPGYSMVASELELLEPLGNKGGNIFKGYVDCVIKVPKKTRAKKGAPIKYNYWILDWKTTSWGWDKRKKSDWVKKMQLALYKHFVAKKLDIPFDDIKCGFVLLKRVVKTGSRFELVDVSIGDQTRLHALKHVTDTINLMNDKMWLKERGEACRYCEFFATEHCSWKTRE